MFSISSQNQAVLNRINEKRQELFELGSRYELTHHQVLRCSQELDLLINLALGVGKQVEGN